MGRSTRPHLGPSGPQRCFPTVPCPLTAPLSSPFLLPPPPGFPSPGCVIFIFTFKFPLPSLSPVAALPDRAAVAPFISAPSSPQALSLLLLFHSLAFPGDPISFPVCLSRAPRVGQSCGVSPTTSSGLPLPPFLGLFFHLDFPTPISSSYLLSLLLCLISLLLLFSFICSPLICGIE